MATLMIENVPAEMVKKYGGKINYTSYSFSIHKRPDNSMSDFETRYYNVEDDTYGPFNGAHDTIAFLNRDRHGD